MVLTPSISRVKKKKHRGTKIVYVGRLIKDKGVQDLLRAVKGLDVQTVIVGEGKYKKELRKLGGRFVGEKHTAGVRDMLAQADLFVNPSYGEGLPTTVLEAGAMGLPVIATDVGGTKEIIDNGKNGYLVKPGNIKLLRSKIQSLLKNKKMRARFGKVLQKKVRSHFDWNKITDKMEKVLTSL